MDLRAEIEHFSGQRTGAVGDTHFIDVVNCKVSIGGT